MKHNAGQRLRGCENPRMTATLTITRPDDWHLHVRDSALLHAVVPHTARQFGRAIIMPNLAPPITTAGQALAYRDRIRAAVPVGAAFEPLMTLYLTDALPPGEIARAKYAGVVAVKLYPAGATTNSAAGVTDLRKTYPTLEAMQRAGLPLLVHGEVTDPAIDIFDREDINAHVRANEGAFRATLEKLYDLPIVGDVRGDGYFYGIELVKDKVTRETFDDDESERLLRGFLSKALFDAGLYCRADDRGDPVDGHRGLGDVGGEDHLALA